MDLLFEVLRMQHKDLLKSSQLVPKLKQGCEEWLKLNRLPDGYDTQQYMFNKKDNFDET